MSTSSKADQLNDEGEIPNAADSLAGVIVVIPALNEEDSLPLVLRDLPAVGQVIVVDNGSTDKTPALAAENGARVILEPRRGYGSACLRGLQTIADDVATGKTPPEVVAFVDADYSDHVHLMPQIAGPVLAGEFDFVLGSRMLGEREPGAMPPQAVWGNRLCCFLMKFFGGRYTDLGPFRAINYQKLLALGMVDTNFGWTVEMQLKALRHKLSYKEIPVPYRRRIGVSKISGTISGTVKAGTRILTLIARYGLLRR